MKKILPIELRNGIDTECWHNSLISAILTNKNNYAWYAERFIDFYFYKLYFHGYFLKTTLNGFYAEYSEVVEKEIPKYDKNIIELIKQKINEKKYLSIYCNAKNYIKFNDERLHEFFVIGYDDEGIYFLNYFRNQKKVDFIINEEFIQIFEQGKDLINRHPYIFDIIHGYSCPLTCYKVKSAPSRVIDLTKIIKTIEMILDGVSEYQSSKNYQHKFFHSDRVTLETSKQLISLQRGEKTNLYLIITLIHKLYESRNGLLFRLDLLKKINNISLDKSIYENISNLCIKILKCQNLVSKLYINGDKDKIATIIKLLKEIKKSDFDNLTILLNELKKEFYISFNQMYGTTTKIS